jgi:hypothetical protein
MGGREISCLYKGLSVIGEEPAPWSQCYVRIHRDNRFIRNQQISIKIHGVISKLWNCSQCSYSIESWSCDSRLLCYCVTWVVIERFWYFCNSGILRTVHQYFVTNVSEQTFCPIFKGQTVQERLDCWILKMGEKCCPWNVSKNVPINTA